MASTWAGLGRGNRGVQCRGPKGATAVSRQRLAYTFDGRFPIRFSIRTDNLAFLPPCVCVINDALITRGHFGAFSRFITKPSLGNGRMLIKLFKIEG